MTLRRGVGLSETAVYTLVRELPDGQVLMLSYLDRSIQKGEATLLLNIIAYQFGPPSDSVRQRVE